MADWRSMQKARGGQLERHPSASGVPHSRGGASAASEHGVAACHLRGELETEAHGLPFTDRLDRRFTSRSNRFKNFPVGG